VSKRGEILPRLAQWQLQVRREVAGFHCGMATISKYETSNLEFVSLGMFIIDEIEFATSTAHDVLGGAGTYSAIGARLVSPPPTSKNVGWIVHAGRDFPNELRDVINAWDTSCHIMATPWRQTTRGWNGYGENEHRGQWLCYG